MAAATSVVPPIGRGGPFNDFSFIPVTFTFSATPYVTATGGIAVDLATALTTCAPFSMPYINPLDVVGILQGGALSTNGFLPTSLAIGTPVFTNPAAYPFAGGAASNYPPAGTSQLGPNVRPDLTLTSCPATLRLFGTGAGNALHFAEVADGNITDTVTVWLVVLRNGPNP